jgi:hypothetical protein
MRVKGAQFIHIVFFLFHTLLFGMEGQVCECRINRLTLLLVTDGRWENVTYGQLNHYAPSLVHFRLLLH